MRDNPSVHHDRAMFHFGFDKEFVRHAMILYWRREILDRSIHSPFVHVYNERSNNHNRSFPKHPANIDDI